MDEQSCEDLYSVNRNSNVSDKHLFRLAGRTDVRVDEWMDGRTGVCVGLVFEWIYLVTLLC